jgi:hypothetical protein
MLIDSPPTLTQPNIAGAIKLVLVDVKDVVTIPEPDPDGVLNGIIPLQSGALWSHIKSIIPATLQIKLTSPIIGGAKVSQLDIAFSISQLSPSRLRFNRLMEAIRCLGVLEDANGFQWLVGDIDCPFEVKLDEGDSGADPVRDRNEARYIINAITPHPPFFYDSDDGGIFDVQFTQEFI